jgi:hypothetical protein
MNPVLLQIRRSIAVPRATVQGRKISTIHSKKFEAA